MKAWLMIAWGWDLWSVLCGAEKFAVLRIWGSILNTVNEIGDYEECSIPAAFNQLQESYIAVVSSHSQSHSLTHITHTHTHTEFLPSTVSLALCDRSPACVAWHS